MLCFLFEVHMLSSEETSLIAQLLWSTDLFFEMYTDRKWTFVMEVSFLLLNNAYIFLNLFSVFTWYLFVG